jgi:hypothetical protein
MKKKHYIGVAVVLLLGVLATAFGIEYDAYTPITDVNITGTLSNGVSVPINTSYTMTCSTSTDTDHYCDETGDHYPNDPVTHTWSGAGTFNPTTGTSVTWTSPDSTGNKTITVTADDSPLCDETAKTDSITVVVVKVAKIQYNDPDSGWTDAGTLYVHLGTTVQFKAIPDPGTAAWPSGKPVWGGTSGASGSGATTSVTFSTLSTSTSDYKTVTATCGNTVTVNVVVFDFTGTFTPADNFAGRSQSQYGLEEIVALNFTTSPTGVSASQAGGLEWTKQSGVGSLTNTGTDGTADYDAQETAGSVEFRLTIKSGPSKGHQKSYSKTVVAPSGTRMTRVNTNVWHVQGSASAGIQLYYWLDPKEVSFSNLTFGEGSCPSTNVSGFFLKCWPWNSYPTGGQVGPHAQNTFGAISGGNATTGCRVQAPDHASTGAANPYAAGSFTWSMATQYIDGTSTRHSFGSSPNHVSTFQADGGATQAKGGQSGSAALNAPSSSD